MTTTLTAVSLVMELFSWIGIVLGLMLLTAGYLRRLAYSGWTETIGVIVRPPAGEPAPDASAHPHGHDRYFRWLGEDGNLYDLPADTEETAHLAVGDDVTIYVNPRRPDQARTDHAHREGHPLRLIGWIFFGIGAACVVLSLVVAAIE